MNPRALQLILPGLERLMASSQPAKATNMLSRLESLPWSGARQIEFPFAQALPKTPKGLGGIHQAPAGLPWTRKPHPGVPQDWLSVIQRQGSTPLDELSGALPYRPSDLPVVDLEGLYSKRNPFEMGRTSFGSDRMPMRRGDPNRMTWRHTKNLEDMLYDYIETAMRQQ